LFARRRWRVQKIATPAGCHVHAARVFFFRQMQKRLAVYFSAIFAFRPCFAQPDRFDLHDGARPLHFALHSPTSSFITVRYYASLLDSK